MIEILVEIVAAYAQLRLYGKLSCFFCTTCRSDQFVEISPEIHIVNEAEKCRIECDMDKLSVLVTLF